MERPKKIELLARGLVFDGTKVLVCRSVEHGHCYLPGGHVEVGEAAQAAVQREFQEESGLSVVVGPLCFVHEQGFEQGGKRRHELTLVFHVERGSIPHHVPSLEPEIAFEWLPIARCESQRFLPSGMVQQLLEALAEQQRESRGGVERGRLPFASDGLG